MSKGKNQLIAVIDLGTTGNRSVLFDLKGREVAKAYREFPTVSEEHGQSEQDVEDWWTTTRVTMQEAINRAKVDSAAVTAVSVSTQRGTVVPLDAKGQPLARALTWMDTRISPSAEKFEQQLKQRTSLRRALWIKDKLPKIFAKTEKLVAPDSFLYQRLTGEMGSDLSLHIFGVLDKSTLKLSDKISDEVGVPFSFWNEIVKSGSVIGEVTKEAAKQTGLAPGTPVVVGGGDQQCSVVGLGVLKKGIAKGTTGTGTFVVTPIEKETHDPMGVLFCNPHVLPNMWVLEGVLPGSGMILRWFRDNFGHVEQAVAQRIGRDPYDYICDQAAQAPPGCDGLVLFPFFAFSLGILNGLGFEHTRAHVARAILEGAAYAARFMIDTISSTGIAIEELRLDGGGSRSALWRQIQCDVTGKRAIFTHVDEGTALGAAILAAVGRKHYPSIEKAVDEMVHIKQVHNPNETDKPVYDQRYSKWQQLLMNNLQEIMKHV
ncbi:MAG: FGGY-family carbohydrate kinase [Promethearchaeota archaeon]